MKNILFSTYTQYPSPDVGGPNKIIFEILEHLDYSKFRAGFVSSDVAFECDATPDLADFVQEKRSLKKKIGSHLFDRYPLYRQLTSSSFYYRYYLSKIDRRFERFMRDLNTETIIHSHDPLSHFYFRHAGLPRKILTIHSKGSYISELKTSGVGMAVCDDRMLRRVAAREAAAFASADIVTFPSAAAKAMYLCDLNSTDAGSKDIRIVYNGIDCGKIASVAHERGILRKYGIGAEFDSVILNVASHVKQKNIPALIDTMKILVHREKKHFLLINIGRGPETPEYSRLIARNDLDNHVKIIPSAPNDDIIRLMKACDFFVMASKRVVFDMVILEALAAGACVIAADDGGNKEIITDGWNGYLLKDCSPEAVAAALLHADRGRVKANAASSVERFSTQKMISAYEGMYEL